jgi:hypothetical protein
MSLTPEEEHAVRVVLDNFPHLPELMVRRAVLKLREEGLELRGEQILASLKGMDPRMGARALGQLADEMDELADDYGDTLPGSSPA